LAQAFGSSVLSSVWSVVSDLLVRKMSATRKQINVKVISDIM